MSLPGFSIKKDDGREKLGENILHEIWGMGNTIVWYNILGIQPIIIFVINMFGIDFEIVKIICFVHTIICN